VKHGSLDKAVAAWLKARTALVVEPWRAAAFPIIRDLMVDRSAFDRIIEAGGYITAPTGGAPDANIIPIPKPVADAAMDAAECIGCGACAASCPNSSAMLFASNKVAQLAALPQGQVEAKRRVVAMLDEAKALGFGNCTNHKECEVECPKAVKITNIARLNREFIKATVVSNERI